MEEEVELQISVNIGAQHHELRVPRGADLAAFVQHFLAQNSLNPKYHSHILRLVTHKLKEEAQINQQASSRSSNNATTEETTEPLEEKQAAQESQRAVNNNKSKSIVLGKIQREIEAKGKENPPDSRKVYEQWKQKEKEKKEREARPKKSSEPDRAATQRERHDPDFFYKKGVEFQSNCSKNNDEAFRKLYPFRTTERTLSQLDQLNLVNRLSRDKSRPIRHLFEKKGLEMQATAPLQVRDDPVKERVRQQDEKIDRLIYRMIKERSVTPRRPEQSRKSPFRKTVIK